MAFFNIIKNYVDFLMKRIKFLFSNETDILLILTKKYQNNYIKIYPLHKKIIILI